MPQLDLPQFTFSQWERWRSRPRPSQVFDVPAEFGIRGLYLLANSESAPIAEDYADEKYLHPQVIYIGESSHVDQRLERTHNAVRRYREANGDANCDKLWFSVWRSQWTNWDRALAGASLALYERALLLAYVKRHEKYPALNRR